MEDRREEGSSEGSQEDLEKIIVRNVYACKECTEDKLKMNELKPVATSLRHMFHIRAAISDEGFAQMQKILEDLIVGTVFCHHVAQMLEEKFPV